MAITFRTTGAWGAGKGSNLTNVEVDTNFYEIHLRVLDLETNPPEAVSIDHFEIEGTLLTIVMTDGSEHGPFVLPVAQWRWTGEWQPATQYFVGDIIEESANIYFVRVQHISGPTFDPELFTPEGQVYVLILAKATQPYDIGMFYNDVVRAGEDLIMVHVAARAFSIGVNFPLSQAWLGFATLNSTITLPVYKNIGEIIGTITFVPGELVQGTGQFGTFTTVDSEDPVEFLPGDRLSVGLPYEDDTSAAMLSVTIATGTPSL